MSAATCFQADFGHVMHGVLLEVELAALPGNAGQDGFACGPEPGVVIAGDEPHAVHSALGL